MKTKVEHYPKYVPVVEVPMPEFLDALNALSQIEDSLDITIDVDMSTIKDMERLAGDIEAYVPRMYYKGVVERWRHALEQTTETTLKPN